MRIDSIQKSSATPVESREDRKLKEACQNFEAIFLGQILKSMRQTIVKTDLFGKSENEDTFQEMMDSETCKNATKTHSVGISDILYRQLSALLKDQNNTNEADTRGSQNDITKRID